MEKLKKFYHKFTYYNVLFDKKIDQSIIYESYIKIKNYYYYF